MNAEKTFFRYLPIGERDRAWGMHVRTAGYVHIPTDGPYPPAGHPQGYAFRWNEGRVLSEFQIHYIARGRGTFESAATGRKKIESGTAFLLFPGVWHRYRPLLRTGWDEYWVGFNGAYPRQLASREFFSHTQAVLRVGEGAPLLDTFLQLLSVLRDEPIGFSHLIAAHTHVLLGQFHQLGRTRGRRNDRNERVIRTARQLLEQQVDRDVELPRLAQRLGVGYAWLRRVFQHATGLSLKQYHLQLRLHLAQNLLAATDLSAKEIAARIGLEDAHYFSRLFQNKTGRSPLAWRKLSRRAPRGKSASGD